MRGQSDPQGLIFFSYDPEERIPADHPLREIKRRADAILRAMSAGFDAAYSARGRRSIPPEQMLKALLLRALYSIPSEAKLMEAIEYNFLYRWFVGMSMDARAWTPESFSMNRERFEKHALVRRFFERIVASAIAEDFASCDHFTIDGTLIRSLASHKSLARRDADERPHRDDDPGNPSVDWRGERRTNATHASATDPEARLYRKAAGREAHLCHSGHVFMENRKGLIIDMEIDAADGRAERRAAREMIRRARRRHPRLRIQTVGADAGYDDGAFLHALESRHRIVAHVPVRRGVIAAQGPGGEARRRARQRSKTEGYAASQRIRKRVEEIFGWCKVVGGLARTRFVGRWRIAQDALMVGAAYNLLRMARLKAAA